MNAHSPTAQPSRRIATLDVLRLFAALAVVGFHLLYRGTLAGEQVTGFGQPGTLFTYGFLGVELFFLISGFVIAWSSEGRTFDQFAMSRIARLYPGFVVAVILTFAVTLAIGSDKFETSLIHLFANLTMFAPAFGQPFMDGVYWSIVLELIFYGWVTLLLFFGVFHRYKLQILAIWLCISAIDMLVLHIPGGGTALLTRFAPYFAAGILIYECYFHRFTVVKIAMIAVCFGLGILYARDYLAFFIEDYSTPISYHAIIMCQALIFWFVIAAVEWRDKLPSTPAIVAMGGITYPLYLLHQHIGYMLIDLLAPVTGRWPAFAIVLAAVVVLSWLVYRFVEPLGRKWVFRIVGPVMAAIVSATERLRPHLLQPGE